VNTLAIVDVQGSVIDDQRYRSAVAAGGVGVWDWNLATGEIYVDPLLKRMLGYEDHEIRNHLDDWGRLLHRDDAARVLASAQAHIAGETPLFEVEHRMVHRDGSNRWFLARGLVTRDAEGRAISVAGTHTDVTKRKRSEGLGAAQRRVLELITTGSPLADVLSRLVLLIEQLSDGMLCSVLLLDDDGVTMRHGAAPSLPADYVRAIDGAQAGPRAGSCGTAMHLRKRVVATDILSDVLWEDYRDAARLSGMRACWSTPICSPEGGVLGSFAMYYSEPRAPGDHELEMIESAADVARVAIEHHHAQQALRRSEERNRAILRAIPDLMFVTNLDGVYLDFHANDVSRLYIPPSMFLGKNLKEVLPPPLAKSFLETFARLRDSEDALKLEYELGPDDDKRLYEACIVGCDGNKVLTIVRDVTDRKQAEVEAATQRLELAHLSRVALLGELTGALAHELSQPLTAILSNAQAATNILNREPVDVDELRGALNDVIESDRRARDFIDRLRAMLRKEGIRHREVDLNDVVREVVDLSHSECVSRRTTVATALSAEIPRVLGDRVQLQQVVLNLLLNACDAMRETPVLERCVAVATTTHDGFVELTVSDRGTGIPTEQLDRVFEPFVTFREDGLGLGLTISRSIVRTHGGSIEAENNAEGGATFKCFLPIAEHESTIR
jgi:PAS domain S-box-containing protein